MDDPIKDPATDTRGEGERGKKKGKKNHRRRRRGNARAGRTTLRTSWHDGFLKSLSVDGNVTLACRAAGINKDTAYNHQKRFRAFGRRWAEAIDDARDHVREVVFHRGVEGWDEPVYGRPGPDGKPRVIGVVHKFSERLLELEAKRRDPEYRDRHQFEGVTGGVTIQFVFRVAEPPKVKADGEKAKDQKG